MTLSGTLQDNLYVQPYLTIGEYSLCLAIRDADLAVLPVRLNLKGFIYYVISSKFKRFDTWDLLHIFDTTPYDMTQILEEVPDIQRHTVLFM